MEEKVNLSNIDDDLQHVLQASYLNTFTYLQLLYPDRYYNHTSAHQKIFDAIDAIDEKGNFINKYVVVKAPRGFGKSTIVKGLFDKRIRYNQMRYGLYLGKNATFSIKQTESIKRSITQNKLGQQLFGSIKADAPTATTNAMMFNKEAWITSNGIMVLPRGWKQPVRGEIFDWEDHSYRPDFIVCDDLEDKEEILNDEIRAAIKEKFYSDVLPCVSQDPNANFQFIYIDTLKHNDSLLQELLDDPKWLSIEISVCDLDYKTLIPELYPQERINEMVEWYRNQGKLGVFYREFMGIATSQEDLSFRKEDFQYYEETDPSFQALLKHPDTYTLVICDPAKTVTATSADSAIIVTTINTLYHKIFFRGGISAKLHADELYKHLFDLFFYYEADVIGIEKTGLNEFIEYPIHTRATELGIPKKFIHWLTARKASDYGKEGVKGKIARIGQLAPFYRMHRIYHNQSHELTERLELQLLTFPRAKLVDISDAFAYWLELLEMAEIYFQDYSITEDSKEIEKEYEGLYTQEEMQALEFEGII